jgi:phage terminase small subunit
MPRKYKWEIFVDKVIGGMAQRQAYKSTFDCKKMTDEQIDIEASNLLNGTGKYAKNPKASLRYKELNQKAKEQADNEAIADATEVMKYFTAVMRGESYSSVLARCEDGSETVIEKPPDEKERLDAAKQLAKRYGLDREEIERQAKIEKLKAEIARLKGESPDDEKADDGFLEALQSEAESVWQEQ